MKKTYVNLVLPKGTLNYCWFDRPDNFGKYSVQVVIPKDDCKAILEEITQHVDKFYDRTIAELKGKVPPKILSEYKKGYPFADELDKNNDFSPTGNIIFKPRSTKPPIVVDARLQKVEQKVFGGSTGKVKVTLNFYHDAAKRTIGASMWLGAVQVLSFGSGSSSSLDGFSVEEPPSDDTAKADF